MSKSFLLQESSREGNSSVFLKISGSENFYPKKFQKFRSKISCLTLPKIFVEGIFWCLRVPAFGWHKLKLHTLKIIQGKQLGESRNSL